MKKVLLTGGSRGIGEAIYNELKENYSVIAPSSKELDLNDTNSIEYFLNSISDIDILINNAGINFIRKLEDISSDELSKIMQTNLIAPLQLSQKIAPGMKKLGGGKIVNISSIWGIRSKEFRTLYSMTKFGLIGQTKALARELGEYNILVNAICPGFTMTDLTASTLSKEEILQITEEIPLKRMAKPSEIAKTIKFLISDENSYITGQTIIVDGGFLA